VKQIPPNPYLRTTRAALSDSCSQRARELERGPQRTPAERAALAEDTRYLLIAAARALDPPGATVPNTPEQRLHADTAHRESVEALFLALYERECAAVRLAILDRAFLAVRGRALPEWPLNPTVERARESLEGLTDALKTLDQSRGPPERQR